jgi:hypothetical protein
MARLSNFLRPFKSSDTRLILEGIQQTLERISEMNWIIHNPELKQCTDHTFDMLEDLIQEGNLFK